MKSFAAQKHFFLSCDSKTISTLTQATGKQVVSFSQTIDSLVGAYAISLQIALNRNLEFNFISALIDSLVSRMLTLRINPPLFLPLRLLLDAGGGGAPPPPKPACTQTFVIRNKAKPCAGDTMIELIIDGVSLISLVLSILSAIAATILAKYLEGAVRIMSRAVKLIAIGSALASVATALFNFVTLISNSLADFLNTGDALIFAANIVASIPLLVTIIQFIQSFVSLWDKIVSVSGAMVEITANALVIAVVVAATIYSAFVLCNQIRTDWND